MRQFAVDNLASPAQLLDAALHNIVGFDLNPLSVIAARTNYILALGDILRYRGGKQVDLPVYLCDSVLTPTERSDIFGKSYRLHTIVGDFDLPGETIVADEVGELAYLIEKCLSDEYTADEFLESAKGKLSISEPMTETSLEALYRRLYKLEEENRNGIWARLIKNEFSPVLVGKFDYVVGNPPWVNWESLSQEYRDATLALWKDYGLFSLKGHAARLGGGKKDLSMLFTYTASDNYLQEGGKLGFVITQTVFQTKGAGDGFRRFRLGDREHLQIISVDDMVELQPFEGATNWTAIFVLQKGKPTKYPITYVKWHKKKGAQIKTESSLEEVIEATTREELKAQPVDSENRRSPWMTVKARVFNVIKNAMGNSDYRARAGVTTWADGVYWLKILKERPDGKLIVENLPEKGKLPVKKIQAVVEPDLVFPFIGWKEIDHFKSDFNHYILLPQDPEKRKGYDESWMKLQLPDTYSYLKKFEEILRKRSGYMKYFDPKDPFYSIYNVADYTFSPYKVIWRTMGSSIKSTVLEYANYPLIGEKCPIHKNTVISVSVSELNEAHYLCAVMNSKLVTVIAKSYSVQGGKGFGSTNLLEMVRIPQFNQNNQLHVRLSELSKEAHELVKINLISEVKSVTQRINDATAMLWDIDTSDLKSISR